ncbi:hypothetical protein D3C87_1462130 [compost metagenome]
MGVDAALGEARGARGVGHHGHVVRAGRVRARLQAGAERLGPRRGARRQRMLGGDPRGRRVFGVFVGSRQRVRVLGGQHVLELLVGRQFGVGLGHAGGKVSRADRHARLAIGHVVLELLGPVHRVDGYHHRVRTQDRVVADDELRAVLHVQQHAVALLHAGLLLEPARQRRGLRLQRAERDGIAEVADRRLLGVAARGDFEVEPERGLGQHDLRGQPLRPELEMRTRGRGGHLVSWVFATGFLVSSTEGQYN